MSAPQYVPHGLDDRPRRGEPLPPARGWRPLRPGDLTGRQPAGEKLGSQGPDQGYVLKLLPLFDDRLELTAREDRHDVDAGVIGVALKRASLLGRAPVVHDLEVGYRLFGYLDPPVPELVDLRRTLFTGAAHSYRLKRAISDAVPEESLRRSPAEVTAGHQADWRSQLAI